MKTQNTKCNIKECENECYKGATFEYDGKDFCSELCRQYFKAFNAGYKKAKKELGK